MMMKTKDNIDYWSLMAKYYANECSNEEVNQLNSWISENPENEILFYQVKEDLENINLSKSMKKVNVDLAWDKVKNRIQETETEEPSVESKVKTLTISRVFKYAAAIVLLVSIGFFVTKMYQSYSKLNVYAENTDQGKVVTLPDGSRVTLNSDSKLIFPKKFAQNERRVKLEGEAFFDVSKNAEHPFIIETKSAEVKVLGTTFNVNAKYPGDQVEVFVETGLVQLSDIKNTENKIIINPGDVGTFQNTSISKSPNMDVNRMAWKTKELVFKENYIRDVISTLNRTYNTNITCNDESVLNLRYTVTFRNQEIESVLNVIAVTFDLKIEQTETEIKLVKKSI